MAGGEPIGSAIVRSNITLERCQASVIALIACGCAAPGVAATSTADISVSLVVQATCTVSASPLAFNADSITQTAASITISATCSNTAADYVSINVETASHAMVTTHRVAGLTRALLSYGTRQTAARGSYRGINTGMDVVVETDGSNAQSVAIFQRAPALQNVAFGLYGDVVTITVSY